MAAVIIAVRVIDRDSVEDQVIRLNTKGLDGRVLNIEASDSRVIQIVGIEELWLCLATIGTLAIPPALSTTVDGVVGSTSNDDVRAGDTDQRSIPFLVAEGGLAVKDDLHT